MSELRQILRIALRSLRQHGLATAITAFSVALAAGLVLAIFNIEAQARRTFTGGDLGFDAVLGARGSQLQLVLNAVFHLETSPGNIPWSLYKQIAANPAVDLAIPYAVGDNYRGYRIVGTSDAIFEGLRCGPGRSRRLEFAAGGPFLPTNQEAVLGSFAARQTGLRVGDAIHPYHGLIFNEEDRHDEEYVVTGIMRPTNTPLDRVILIPIEGIFRMKGHVLRGTGETYTAEAGREIADEHKEVSAVMLRLRDGDQTAGFQLSQLVNRQGKVATLAWPIGSVMADLFDKLGWMNRVLRIVAYLVVVVSAGSISAAIYNTISERRREFAILRALGARRSTVFGVIVAESTIISAIGCAAGFAIYAAVFSGAAAVVRAQTGVVLEVWSWHPVLVAGPAGIIALGAVAGLLPAVKAYRTDVAEGLAPST